MNVVVFLAVATLPSSALNNLGYRAQAAIVVFVFLLTSHQHFEWRLPSASKTALMHSTWLCVLRLLLIKLGVV